MRIRRFTQAGLRHLALATALFGASVAGTFAAVPTFAAAPVSVPPLPTSVVRPANPGKGVPFDGNILIVTSGARIDLAKYGYVEEEYFVSGRANVYQYAADGSVEVKTPDMPYTTRILVRKPRDPKRFSGTIQVDVAHPAAGGSTFGWSAEYIIRNGHGFVTITTRRTGQGTSAIESIKAFDPARYAPLNFTEDGLTWDIIGQVGRLLKTQTPNNPFNGYNVQRLYAQGWSGSGALLLFYIGDGFHQRARMPGGGPIFSGYLVGEPSGYPRINSTSAPAAENDPRQRVRPRDVPAITLHTWPQPQNRRRPDGDTRGDRYRVYEVPGSAHGQLRLPTVFTQRADAFAMDGPFKCKNPISHFPFHHYYQSTLARIDAWSRRGIAPPPSQRIVLTADGKAQLDKFGTPEGGVRSTYTDVPIASYSGQNESAAAGASMCQGVGSELPLSKAQLSTLYPSRGDYVSNVVRRANELERQGWLLPYNAEDIRQEAQRFKGF